MGKHAGKPDSAESDGHKPGKPIPRRPRAKRVGRGSDTGNGRTRSAGSAGDELQAGGYLAPGWRRAFKAVPRHLFIPDRVWHEGPDGYRMLRRADDQERWWDLAYSDEAIVTQVEDGQEKDLSAYPSSSASMPRMVASMLAALDADAGHRVLEIGTGTG